MARAVYDSATITIAATSFECSDVTVSINQNTTPDWEAFTIDYVQNYPTTYSFTITGNCTLDSANGAKIGTWLTVAGGTLTKPETVTVVVDTVDGPTYTSTATAGVGGGTVSCDISASRADFGKVSFSIKGAGALTVTDEA